MIRTSSLRLLLVLLGVGGLAAGDAAPAVPPTARIPLTVLGVAAGDEVSIDGAAAPADAAGVPLPLAKPAEVAWTSQGTKVAHRLTAVAAGSTEQTPPWAKDVPKQEADGSWVLVGFAESATVAMAYQRAMMDARTQAVRLGGSNTTTVVEADGSRTMRTQTSGTVMSQTRDVAIVVSTDAQAARPVTCWVRVAATAEKAAPAGAKTPDEIKAELDAERAFKDLNKKIEQELQKPQDKPKP